MAMALGYKSLIKIRCVSSFFEIKYFEIENLLEDSTYLDNDEVDVVALVDAERGPQLGLHLLLGGAAVRLEQPGLGHARRHDRALGGRHAGGDIARGLVYLINLQPGVCQH